MDREHILGEIARTAAANGGAPLGEVRFEAATGIRRSDWYGIHWARWGDAVSEAGFAPNRLTAAFEDERLFEQYARYAQELGRLPAAGDLRIKRRNDTDFPSWNTFARLGSKSELVNKLLEHCRARPDLGDVAELCSNYLRSSGPALGEDTPSSDEPIIGFVYLLRSGRYHKIGRTNALGRREYELAIQLPERAETVHVIRTDDPPGIEEYWHKRFAGKRKNGEWFELAAADVAAFKRRKFM